MKLHQVLTGAANTFEDKAAIAVGNVEDYPFTVYASGCDVVILLSGFTRVQIIPGSQYGYKEVSCVDACDGDGKIAASYGNTVIVFEPRAANPSADHSFPFHWDKSEELCLNFTVTCLSWSREGKALLIGGDYIQMWSFENLSASSDALQKRGSWICYWTCRPAVSVHLLRFSPDGQYFASVGKHDPLVKVWYDKSRVSTERSTVGDGNSLDFNFIYLAHPKAVSSISWRKTSKYMPSSSVANVLLTSCLDNICRVWCETIEQGQDQQQIRVPVRKPSHSMCLRHLQQRAKKLPHTKDERSSDPLRKFLLVSSLHFHIAAVINPLNDIPMLSSLGPFDCNKSSFVLHWLNNKEIQFTMAAEQCLGSATSAMEVHSVSVSDDSSEGSQQDDSEYDILAPSDDDQLSSAATDEKLETFPTAQVMGEEQRKDKRPQTPEPKKQKSSPFRSKTPLEYLRHLQDDSLSSMEYSPTYSSIVSSSVGTLLREWCKSPDTLIAVHPIDGSLLVWLVDWLDVSKGVACRQTQVSFASRIPSAFPTADANSLLQRLMVYRPREDRRNYTRGRSDQKGSIGTKSFSANLFKSIQTACAHPPAVVVSTHRDGALNHWQLSFADKSAFSTIVSISHLTRRCGHRYPITNILTHPELPLLLSTSSHVINGHHNSDDEKGKATHRSELIVWRVEMVYPLRQSGGVLELTRINSTKCSAFENIAWVPHLFSHSLLSFDASASLPNNAVSPCACFLASDGSTYRFYQIVLDARLLQSYISSTHARTKSALYTSDSESESVHSVDLEEDSEEPDVQVPTGIFIESIVSRQSGGNPGCIMKLSSLVGSRDILKKPLLLHVFTERSVKTSYDIRQSKDLKDEHETSTGTDVRSEEHFYVVGIENVPDQESDTLVSTIHMWHVTITADTRNKSDEVEVSIPVYPEVIHPVSRSSSYTSTQSLGVLDVELAHSVASTVSSEKVCTQRLPLPSKVTVMTATRAADKMSSSAVNPTCPASYLFTTSCSDGRVRFWSCKDIQDGKQFEWEEMSWISGAGGSTFRQTREVASSKPVGLDAPGKVLSLSCAHTGRIATLCQTPHPGPNKGFADLSVCVFEIESSGGMEWVLEDCLRLKLRSSPNDGSQVRLEWISVENSSYILTIAIGSEIFILGCAARSANTAIRGNTAARGVESWVLLQTVHLASESEWQQLLPRALSWVRNGLLVVGLGTEMQVYSQWREEVDSFAADDSNFAPTAKIQMVSQLLKNSTSGELVAISTVSSKIGLFEEAAAVTPVLPQYHPKHLMELMNFGKLRRARAILHHLVYCVAGREAVTKAASHSADHELHRPRLSSFSMSSFKSSGASQSFTETDGRHFPDFEESETNLECIPRLPLYAQLAADKDSSGSCVATENVSGPGLSQGATSEENDYSALFDSKLSASFESDEEGSVKSRRWSGTVSYHGSPAHGPSSVVDRPVYFGLSEARLLAHHLAKKQLPGLTSIEQLELLALADTFATTKVDLEESPGAIERGVQFAKKEGESYRAVGGLMGGPGGGGGGYATTGSIGATVGSGGDVVDECGLRFLLAMRHHTCLMRSLPPAHRAALEARGLSTSQFAWAFHSESEEELLAMVPAMLRGEPMWSELRCYGVGWWIRSNETLRRLIEKVAKAQFTKKQDPLDCALFYLAMKKKNVICGLYRTVRDTRMSTFFAHDFTQDRWRKAALKNAYSLLGKQRFEHAAAFFLLSGALWDAIQVCIGRLRDIQLAMVLARLYEDGPGDTPNYKRILTECVLSPKDQTNNFNKDPFLRSITAWLMKEYTLALQTLILEPASDPSEEQRCNPLAATGNPDVFNFYLYLRKHPLLRRRKFGKPEHDHRKNIPSVLKKAGPHRFTRQQSLNEDVFVDDPLTPMERQLFFKTAHAHFNSGCPGLSLQVLMELPATDISQLENETQLGLNPAVDEGDEESTDETSDMIATGTLGGDFGFGMSGNEITSLKKDNAATVNGGSAQDFDWSKPVSSSLKGGSSDDFDWSQPVSTRLGGRGTHDNSSNGFDCSQPVSAKLGGSGAAADSADAFDWSKPVSAKAARYNQSESDEFDWGKPISKGLCDSSSEDEFASVKSDDGSRDIEEPSDNVDAIATLSPRTREARQLDVVGQQMKFSAILKLLLDELYSIPASCEIAGEDVRPFFLKWLEKEMKVLHKLADYGTVAEESDDEEDVTSDQSAAGEDHSDAAVLPAVGDKNYIAMKIDIQAKRIQWLKRNQTLLTILLNHCALHGASGGDLAAMKMELLLLLHELEQRRSLLSPLYAPSAGPSVPPLILAAVSSYSFLASPINYLQSLTEDILKFLFNLPAPPSPSNPIPMSSVLTALTGTLSDCIYQSLTGVQSDTASKGSHSTPGSSSLEDLGANEPTSLASRWPGVRLLLSLLASENKDNSTRLRVLLAEACVAVYLSLLALAWSSNQPNQLYRLVSNPLKGDMWGLVFGGGVKVVTRPHTETRPRTASGGRGGPEGDKYWNAARQRWNYKLLGKGLTDSMVQSRKPEVKPVQVEHYVTPRSTLVQYFVTKPVVSMDKSYGYDSDDDVLVSDDEEYVSEEENDGFLSHRVKRKDEPRDHLDPDSYSWSVMNYTLSKLVLSNLQAFLPEVGFELSDLPSLSSMLHAATKMLETWNQVFLTKLESFAGPPVDYISQFPISSDSYPRGGKALLRYKALIDPKNTPFRSTHHKAEPAKRLWYTLAIQESLQETFVRYVFHRESPSVEVDEEDSPPEKKQVKILHKDTEGINSFCINMAHPSCIAVGTLRDIQELDISQILNPEPLAWMEDDSEMEQTDFQRRNTPNPDDPDFLMIYQGGGSQSGSVSPQRPTLGTNIGGQSGRGATVLLKRQTHGTKRVEAHPHLPYYITGSQDGSFRMWEFGHAQEIAAHRTSGSFQRVTRIRFSPHGNKVGISDASGLLSLWQVSSTGMSTNPYQTLKCHNKQTNDLVFISSSSFIGTAGHSSDGNNVCLWDTLVPSRSSLVHGFSCHENGAPCLAYIPGQQLLISGGRKGNICIFDLRKYQLRHTFLAHDAAVKSIVIDPNEEYFVSASEDGDIKVWGLTIHEELQSFIREHGKSTYFKYGTQGVALMLLQSPGQLYSCGGDGTVKWRQLSLREAIVNTEIT